MVERKFPPPSDLSKVKAPDSQGAYTFSASTKTDHEKDVDIDFNSVHHTIGKGPTQVAAGDHNHEAKDISGLTVDHGGLTGLGDDDHAQYPKADGTRATGTWPIGITGNAGSVDGQSFSWSNPGTWPTYMWVADTNGTAFLLAASKVPQVTVNAVAPATKKVGDIWVTP